MPSKSATRRPVRVAVRAIIVQDGRMLLVNAWPGGRSDLLCAPGGGAEPHQSLPENLKREVHEETGLSVEIGQVCLVNEFHDPHGTFHQVDIYFRAHVVAGVISPDWRDPEAVVDRWIWATKEEMAALNVKPDSLADVAFGPELAPTYYDALEPILR